MPAQMINPIESLYKYKQSFCKCRKFFLKFSALTLMTKECGVKFAKKNPGGQLSRPKNSQKVLENAKISFLS